MTAGMPSDSAHVFQSCYGGAASGPVDPVLPGAVRELAQVGAWPDHRVLDAVRLCRALATQASGPAGHVAVYCVAPGGRRRYRRAGRASRGCGRAGW